jgi:hypothetical protein
MRPVLITAPFATPDEVAEILGVPKARAQRLMQWAIETAAKRKARQAVSHPEQLNGDDSTHQIKAS